MYFLSGQTKETARSVRQLTNKIHIFLKKFMKKMIYMDLQATRNNELCLPNKHPPNDMHTLTHMASNPTKQCLACVH